jgi:hypothetical protein
LCATSDAKKLKKIKKIDFINKTHIVMKQWLKIHVKKGKFVFYTQA